MTPPRVVVINRDCDTARLAGFHHRFTTAAPGTGYDVFAAVDRPEDPALGLYESHVAVLRCGPGPVLIFEDDAVFSDAFTLDLPEPPPGWFLLRLGGLLRLAAAAAPPPPGRAQPPAVLPGPDAIRVGPHRGPWVPVAIAHQTHAYVAADPGALADIVEARATTDISVALMFALPGHYRLMPATVGQAAGQSTITAGRDRPADEFWET